jgi:SAM-dependent methyltransferase
MFNFLKKKIKILFGMFGLALLKIPAKAYCRKGEVNLNIGCGGYEIKNFISVDFFTEHYYSEGQFRRVNYDMRNDSLPFKSDSVDNIYCSHVIEHIETNYVQIFLEESLRILKSGGVLRICCPDSLFLYKQMKKFPRYYSWHPMYRGCEDAVKCFIDLVATHRSDLPNYGLTEPVLNLPYVELLSLLSEDGVFCASRPGRHISNWDFEKLENLVYKIGFDSIAESRHKGSCSPALQGFDMDLTHPGMSLCVDIIKN